MYWIMYIEEKGEEAVVSSIYSLIEQQGNQLNVDVFFRFLVHCTLYTCAVAYTEQVAFYKLSEKHGHV